MIAAGAVSLLLPRQQAPPLLFDSEGRIELVVLSVNSARSSTLRNAALTSRIVNSLPEYTRVLILAPDREAFTVASNPWPERVGFVDMTERYSLTIWPQDPFVVLQGDEGPRLLASPEFARAEDVEMAGAVARHLGLPVEYSSLSFEGGNIVADREFAFIGADTIRLNAIRHRQTEQEIATRFGEELGKPVVVIGPSPQPIGHIDMMLTPLGKRRLMLADPAWGARIAARDLAENPDAVTAFEQSCEREFFGRADISEVTTIDGKILHPPEIVGTTAAAIADSEAIAPGSGARRRDPDRPRIRNTAGSAAVSPAAADRANSSGRKHSQQARLPHAHLQQRADRDWREQRPGLPADLRLGRARRGRRRGLARTGIRRDWRAGLRHKRDVWRRAALLGQSAGEKLRNLCKRQSFLNRSG